MTDAANELPRAQDGNTPMGVCEFCGEDTDFCDCEDE